MAVQEEQAQPGSGQGRVPLSRLRVLEAAVQLADAEGLEALTMRGIGQSLDVEAMSLYNHVANKDAILEGILDVVLAQIEAPAEGSDWKASLGQLVMSARAVVLRHPWFPDLIRSQTSIRVAMLAHLDSVLGILLDAGFPIDLAHNSIHALGSRTFGFTQDLLDSKETGEEDEAILTGSGGPAGQYPNLLTLMDALGSEGCDVDAVFEFGLNLILDGIERALLAS